MYIFYYRKSHETEWGTKYNAHLVAENFTRQLVQLF